ncbi:hypothetical protein MP638_005501 [Amoeboaphelidium occidentale]|nr:hypothetical protein MP638_005501 [Amoeboaphelidium occidentale]
MSNEVKQPPSQLKRFVLAGTAACMAVTFSNPIEVVKTRLQLQGEMAAEVLPKSARIYKNSLQSFILIARSEGLLSLQKGLLPAYFYQIIMNGVRFSEYDRLKGIFTRLIDGNDDKPNHIANIAAGVCSGVLGAAFGSPFFLVKTRLQSASAKFAVGTQHHYKGMSDAFMAIYREGGYRALLAGAQASMLRTGVGSGIQLSTYHRVRLYLVSNGIVSDSVFADIASSMTSGFMVCVGMNPFDVVSTRLYNQNINRETGRGSLYTGPIDCLVKTVKAEGFSGLYKGFFAHYLRIGPHTVLCFVFLEELRRRFN